MYNCVRETSDSRRKIGSKNFYGTDEKCDQIYLFKCILTKCSIGIFFIKQEHKLGDGLSEN